MLELYMNQTVVWKSKTTVNEYNEATYTSTSIPARFEYKRKLVRDKTGAQVISGAICFTESAVKPDDVITFDGTDWPILSVANQTDLEGNVLFYEASLYEVRL